MTSNAANAKFVLSFRDAKSDTIPGNAKAADVKAKLDAMTTYASNTGRRNDIIIQV